MDLNKHIHFGEQLSDVDSVMVVVTNISEECVNELVERVASNEYGVIPLSFGIQFRVSKSPNRIVELCSIVARHKAVATENPPSLPPAEKVGYMVIRKA